MHNREKYRGIVPPLLTPLLTCETIDEPAYRSMVRYVLDGGAHGVFSMASSGESVHNSRKTWEQASRITLEIAKGVVPVYSGAIAASTVQVIENIQYLEGIGAEIAVVTPPFYTPCLMQSEIARHFETVLDQTEIDICIYNIPGLMGGISIEPETVRALADHEKIIMIKDSSANWDHQQRMLAALQDKDISVMTGGETFVTSGALMGAQGNISGFAVPFPKLFVAAYDAAANQDIRLASVLQNEIFSLMDLMKMKASAFSIMKYMLVAVGIGTDVNAYHTEPLTAEQKAAIEGKAAYMVQRYG